MDQHGDQRQDDQAERPEPKKEWRRPRVTTFGDFAKLTGILEGSHA